MARHHTLPAALIGAFSLEPANRRRERLVWVARRQGEVFRERAENVSRREGFYTIQSERAPWYSGADDETPTDAVDEMWTSAEARLPLTVAAIAAAADTGVIDARDWLRAVDLLAQLFVRTPAYDAFQTEIRSGVGIESTPDYINSSRALNLQKLRPAVMYAHWAILVSPEGSLVTNDCSYTPAHHLDGNRPGYVFPLRHDLAVQLTPGPEDKVLLRTERRLELELPIYELTASETAGLNLLLTANALHEIYGPTEAVVAAAQPGFTADRELVGADYLDPSGRFLAEHECDYYRLLEQFGMELPQGSIVALRSVLPPASRHSRWGDIVARVGRWISQAIRPHGRPHRSFEYFDLEAQVGESPPVSISILDLSANGEDDATL